MRKAWPVLILAAVAAAPSLVEGNHNKNGPPATTSNR